METHESGLVELVVSVEDLPAAAKTERPEDRAHLCLVCRVRLWTPDVAGHVAYHQARGDVVPEVPLEE